MRLEPAMWNALSQISDREQLTIHEICSVVNQHRMNTSLTSAMRVFILCYFRFLADSLERDRRHRPERSIMNRVFRQMEEFRPSP